MKFWMSGEIRNDVDVGFSPLVRRITNEINSLLKKHKFGSGVKTLDYIAIILPVEEQHFFPEMTKYKKNDQSVECRLFIDHRKYKRATVGGRRRLIYEAILRCVDFMREAGIRDLDTDNLSSIIRAQIGE